MGNEFPGADIAPILPAGKLRETEGAVFVPDSMLLGRAPLPKMFQGQSTAREPPLIIRMLFIIRVDFELKARGLKIA